MERVGWTFANTSLIEIQQMSRAELQLHLETRGCAVYDDESTELLRQAAIEDWEGEILARHK